MWPSEQPAESHNGGFSPAGGENQEKYKAMETPSFLSKEIVKSIETNSPLSLEHFRMAVREILSKKCGIDSDVAGILSEGLFSAHAFSDEEKERVNVALAPNGQEFDFSMDGVESLVTSLMINHGVAEPVINLIRGDRGIFAEDEEGTRKKEELLNYLEEIGGDQP